MKREVLGFVGLFCVSRMEDLLIELLEVISMFELSKYLNGILFLRNNKKNHAIWSIQFNKVEAYVYRFINIKNLFFDSVVFYPLSQTNKNINDKRLFKQQ